MDPTVGLADVGLDVSGLDVWPKEGASVGLSTGGVGLLEVGKAVGAGWEGCLVDEFRVIAKDGLSV
jgi:hypothetical protein